MQCPLSICPSTDLPTHPHAHPPNQARKQYIDEREIWVYAINILEGLAALHAKGVVHRGKHAHTRAHTTQTKWDIGSRGGGAACEARRFPNPSDSRPSRHCPAPAQT